MLIPFVVPWLFDATGRPKPSELPTVKSRYNETDGTHEKFVVTEFRHDKFSSTRLYKLGKYVYYDLSLQALALFIDIKLLLTWMYTATHWAVCTVRMTLGACRSQSAMNVHHIMCARHQMKMEYWRCQSPCCQTHQGTTGKLCACLQNGVICQQNLNCAFLTCIHFFWRVMCLRGLKN